MIFLASFSSGVDPTIQNVNEIIDCHNQIPKVMHKHIPLYVQFYEEENLFTALRIGWCESRGNTKAFRDEDNDSGIMQFIPSTWNWVAEKYGLPKWDEWVITRFGQPYIENRVYKTDFGFAQVTAQHSAYWNIKASSLLAQDMYSKVTFKDWNSSKWCWGDIKKWEKLWKQES